MHRAGERRLLEELPLRVVGRQGHGDRGAQRRGGAEVISFVVSTFIPSRSMACRSATMPMIVIMHAPSAVATRSVGEKLSPLPWLSTGASVTSVVPDGPWVARQRRPPS